MSADPGTNHEEEDRLGLYYKIVFIITGIKCILLLYLRDGSLPFY